MAKQKAAIIPLPDKDFDTTEVAIPWETFYRSRSRRSAFSTETGHLGQTDPRLADRRHFRAVGCKADAIAAYRELEKNEAFRHPILYRNITPRNMICCSCLVVMQKACDST